jgi:hypothetical protein
MAHIILTGATGTAGRDTLLSALKSPRIASVTVLSRRPLDSEFQGHPKIKFIEHRDYNTYPENLLKQLSGNTACIWCLGLSSVGMKEDEYRVITHDYALSAAKAFSSMGKPEFRFVYLSGQGSTWEPGYSTQMFGKVKGETEKALAQLPVQGHPALVVHSARPAYIRPTHPKEGLGVFHKVFKAVFNPMWLPKSIVIESTELGNALVKLASPAGHAETEFINSKGGPSEEGVWANTELLKLAYMSE